jgi:hypothetical protein
MKIIYILSHIVPEGAVCEIEFYDGADSRALDLTCKNIKGKNNHIKPIMIHFLAVILSPRQHVQKIFLD